MYSLYDMKAYFHRDYSVFLDGVRLPTYFIASFLLISHRCHRHRNDVDLKPVC